MKKSIVFVIPSLDAGGGEKSLINLLNTINYDLYDVDLLLFYKSGLFLKLVPPQVKILQVSGNFLIFKKGLLFSLLGFLFKLNFYLFFNRLKFAVKNNLYKNKAIAEQKNWEYVNASIPKLRKNYDAAIGFLEKSSNYYVVHKIYSRIKIGWIHTNYSASGMSNKFDYSYFKKLNFVVSVSAECQEDLELNFPNFKDKIKCIHNIVSPGLILKLANEHLDFTDFDSSIPLLVTVARLSHEKGIDVALEAATILKKNNINFKWLIIGDGSQKSILKTKIKEYNLKDNFILMGLKQNPYPFIKAATVYIQPSRYEGKSIAIDEAKILAKPIIVTDYPTAKDQINTNVNGIICEASTIHLAKTIADLLLDSNTREKFILNLNNENLSTENEINKLYALINESK